MELERNLQFPSQGNCAEEERRRKKKKKEKRKKWIQVKWNLKNHSQAAMHSFYSHLLLYYEPRKGKEYEFQLLGSILE